ncbi:related to pyridoxamine phosphate oxidase family protein [Cephalotrichum gorgonifer]|uniref:Related to pyridoxamine phosphate oxidase family protein n=1 Tax=Cephalotrichum gorgonifer TaxID=2041049 RepID=A0AAE8MVR7_9PEZI|nr:related to pyridoxamine phosphate oxidase family protein [Cephalotrichum gorgonifer]
MKIYDSLSDDLTRFIHAQPLFLTASAPTHGAHVNVSPKGMSSSHLAVLSPNRVSYIDRTGSGCETVAHVYENGRLTLMFMSFGPSPRIMRLFCRGRVVEHADPGFRAAVDEIVAVRSRIAGEAGPEARSVFQGARAVIVGDIWRVTTSCGFAVPMVRLGATAPADAAEGDEGADGGAVVRAFQERDVLDRYIKGQVEKGIMPRYQRDNNSYSLDGLPALKAARRDGGESLLWADVRARATRLWHEKVAVCVGFLLAVLVYRVGSILHLL